MPRPFWLISRSPERCFLALRSTALCFGIIYDMGGVKVRSFLIDTAENIPTIIATLAFSIWIFWRYGEHVGLHSFSKSILTGALVTASALVGCLSFAVIQNLLTDSEFFVVYQGVLFLSPVCYYIIARTMKMNYGVFFDLVAPVATVVLLVARLNCLRTGCCEGRYIFNIGLNWPTREAEFILAAFLLVLFLKKLKKDEGKGQLFPLLMMIHGTGRFFIEGFINEQSRLLGVHPVHIWSIISVIVGGSIYFEKQAQAVDAKKRKTSHRRK